MTVEARNVNGQLLIKIINTYNGTVNRREDRLLSSKGVPHHGMGLQNIKKVVETDGGILRIDYNAKIFTLMVALPST